MKSYRQELWFQTPHRRDYINITSQVEKALKESGVREGLCLVNAMHITPGVANLSCHADRCYSRHISLSNHG